MGQNPASGLSCHRLYRRSYINSAARFVQAFLLCRLRWGGPLTVHTAVFDEETGHAVLDLAPSPPSLPQSVGAHIKCCCRQYAARSVLWQPANQRSAWAWCHLSKNSRSHATFLSGGLGGRGLDGVRASVCRVSGLSELGHGRGDKTLIYLPRGITMLSILPWILVWLWCLI